jgi:hypothetical protein
MTDTHPQCSWPSARAVKPGTSGMVYCEQCGKHIEVEWVDTGLCRQCLMDQGYLDADGQPFRTRIKRTSTP